MDSTTYESVVTRAQFLEGVYENKVRQQTKLKTELADLANEKDVLEKVEKVLKHLIDRLAKSDLSKMDKLVTYGLKSVFPDRNIKFQSCLEERGKKVIVSLKTLYNDNAVDPSSRSSIQVIESFILRLLCVFKLKRAPFLILDETFSALHADYIPNVSELINELATKLKMDIILVTHNPNLSEAAQNSYRISCRNDETRIEKIK